MTLLIKEITRMKSRLTNRQANNDGNSLHPKTLHRTMNLNNHNHLHQMMKTPTRPQFLPMMENDNNNKMTLETTRNKNTKRMRFH